MGWQDFAGRWRLARSENFDAYLKSLNVSAAHRRFATAATVDHEIEHVGTNKIRICVINRLGKACDVVEPGGAAALAAALAGKLPIEPDTVIMLTGRNVDPTAYAATIAPDAA